MQIGTSEAAQRLGISSRRLRALLETGRIPGQQISGRWVINEGDLARFLPRRSSGRPLTRRSAWQLINHIQDGTFRHSPVGDVEPIERHRLNLRLQRLRESRDPLDLICSMLTRRADKVELSVNPADLCELRRDARIRLSGISHPAAGLLTNSEVEAYVTLRDYHALVKDWFLVQVSAGRQPNVVLHVAEEIPETIPPLLVAVDLAERGGVRENASARQMIRSVTLG